MIPAIRAEFRKLLTVRATYVLLLIALGLDIFFTLYVQGYNQTKTIDASGYLASQVTSAAQTLGFFIALAGVLLVTHEYRYNTILYSLTSAPRRTYVIAAKFITISVFSIVAIGLLCLIAPYLTQLGLHLRGTQLAPQDFQLGDLLLRAVAYGWGYSMLAFIISLLIRNQVGVIAFLLVVPGVAEALLRLLLKGNAQYLPFSTLDAVLNGHTTAYPNPVPVLLTYVVGGLAVAWLLFIRRDAN